jgi:hypothetical protein
MPTQEKIMNDITQPQPQDIYWEQQIQSWKLSGLSQARFCKNNNLTYHRFVYWRGKFDDATRVPPKQNRGGFATVSVRPDADRGLTLSLPNGLVMRGICAENLSVVRQLLDQL